MISAMLTAEAEDAAPRSAATDVNDFIAACKPKPALRHLGNDDDGQLREAEAMAWDRVLILA